MPVVPCGVPDAPGSVTAGRADGAATVQWVAPYNQGCNITGYTVTASSGQSMNVAGDATRATFAGLRNGTSYTFTVVARNEVGPGASSAASNAVVPAGPPGTPQCTSATPDTRQVTVRWNAANPNGAAITTYQLSVDGGGWENVGTGTATTRTGLANGTNYGFRVRAVNDVGPGEPCSPGVSARTPGEPGQVGGLGVSADGRGRICASWSAPNDNGKPITRYEVDRNPGGTFNEGSRSLCWGGLPDDTRYEVRVRACNEIGCGTWSATGAATTPPTPQTVNINWSKGANGVGVGTCNTPSCRWVDVTGSGLTPGRTYSVQCHSRAPRRGGWRQLGDSRAERQPQRQQRLRLRLPRRALLGRAAAGKPRERTPTVVTTEGTPHATGD